VKYLISLLLGLFVGAALLAVGVIYNPFVGERALSALSVTDAEVISLGFSAVPGDSIVFTNNGESVPRPVPPKVLQLWEPPIRLTSAMVTMMRDARGQPAGLGIKFSSRSERTALLKGDAIVDSVWYVYLPGRGSLFIEQSENYWSFIRDVVVPAYRSSANNWKGNWNGNLTAGPGALGVAAVTGGSGAFRDLRTIAVESLDAHAYSTESGLLSGDGRLAIEVPRPEVRDTE